ncbi:MAG: hypothetical protein A3I02_16850 [Betaproteobacteria bacterium RIFCSPLOWO2_02_FULL_67_26]|nr:MAG: hypothetical protein A3I02_16850 [Betaproteobacteria bacterium RIFCSPLOWO2_02_FULL_67_26]
MAGWITAFKAIPWAELLAAAPVVAQGARKLWASVKKKDTPPPVTSRPEDRMQALEAQVDELRNELTATSELVTTLAEHNSRLVEAVAVLRTRTRALLLVCAVMAVLLAGLGIAVALK